MTFNINDEIEVIKMSGNNNEYYYSGDQEEVPIGTRGKITEINTPFKIVCVLINSRMERIHWAFSPDEIAIYKSQIMLLKEKLLR